MLYKRPGSSLWHIEFSFGGQKIRRSAKTSNRKIAEALEHKIRESILRQAELGEKPSLTWAEACNRWLEDRALKRSVRTDRYLFKSMDAFFEGCTLDELTPERIRKYAALIATRASPATANRHLDLLRAVFKYLKKWDLVAEVPMIERYEVEAKEPVWATREQVDRLLAELPDHARVIVQFAVATGLRKSNVTGLRWDWIDLERGVAFIPASKAKGKRTIPVPLSDEALTILNKQAGKNPEYVFTDDHGHAPVADVKTAWYSARKRAGMPAFRFHDLRHTWASWHTQSGTPERVLQELGGWSSNRMVQRYAHLGLDHLASFANNAANKPRSP